MALDDGAPYLVAMGCPVSAPSLPCFKMHARLCPRWRASSLALARELGGQAQRVDHKPDVRVADGGLCECRVEIGRAFMQVSRPLKDSDIQAWLVEFDADGNGIIDEVFILASACCSYCSVVPPVAVLQVALINNARSYPRCHRTNSATWFGIGWVFRAQ